MEASRRQSLGRSGDLSTGRKSILKRDTFIDVRDDLDRALATATCETPEQWFKRILASRQMSPLDLCDRFCFGDARKHRHVLLKHVCDVLFELEEPGCDPMSEAMEEFLYQFSFGGDDGEIVVDIKEALRTLDIWKTTAPIPSPNKERVLGAPKATVSPAKAAILEVKAEKLKKVIDSLQQENLRLSRALQNTETETRPPSPLRIAVKKPPLDTDALAKPVDSLSKQPPSPIAVDQHERELIALANRLEYTGVKRLEEFLIRGDKTASGFVSLKQLRWLLVNECKIGEDVSETKLMELCLGMNFNAQGLLDYKELVRVLLDVLIYESRPTRRHSNTNEHDKAKGLSEADEVLLTKAREYLKGFYGGRDKNRELLALLCDKYDLEDNQNLSLTELIRIFQSDLASHHPTRLRFPLTQDETRRLLQCLSQRSPQKSPTASPSTSQDRDADFVHYPTVLDSILRDTTTFTPSNAQTLLSRVLQPDFWLSLRSALCPHDDARLERKIHEQLCKILMKLDPSQRFLVTQRHFVRVFDQHWSSRDIETLVQALSSPLDGRRRDESSLWVRYDVLMRLLFGAPELRDTSVISIITKKLQNNRAKWQNELKALMATSKHSQTLSYHQVCEFLCEDDNSLNVTEFLYLVAHVQHHSEHRVDVHKLWKLLTTEVSPVNGTMPDSAGKHRFLRRCLRVLADDHSLEKAINRLSRHEPGVVRVDDLVRELCAQLIVLKLSWEDQAHVSEESIRSLIRSLDSSDEFISPGPSLIYTHALMDAIFDWDVMTSSLRLPDRLLDVKKTFELFDWNRNGSIDADDFTKAWRQLTAPTHSEKQRNAGISSSRLHDWEIRVLVRRFPAGPSTRRSPQGLGGIDYSRLLVSLLERQQRVAREQLQDAVLALIQQTCERVTQGKRHMTTFHLEKAFEQIDREGKGYFHVADLRAFVLDELKKAQDNGMDVKTLLLYANQGPALESVMTFLIGDKNHKANSKKVVSLMRFQELMNHGLAHTKVRRRSRSRSRGREGRTSSDGEDTTSADESGVEYESRRSRSSRERPIEGHITLLRDLELCVFEICKIFVDEQGQISPSTAYAHLNGAGNSSKQNQRRPRSQSPVRSIRPPPSPTSSLSCSYSSRRSSCSTPRSIAESSVTVMDPLMASRLKQTLRSLHGVETSTHLISQFFLRLGSSTKHFLDLPLFAQWIAPLTTELQSRVKQIVREMVIKSKSGGGHLDLERFIATVDRRLLDAHATEDAMVRRSGEKRLADHKPMGLVRPSALLTKLHQLNVSMRKPEMVQLLRHFGMETQQEIDYGIFLRRLYELAQQLPQSSR